MKLKNLLLLLTMLLAAIGCGGGGNGTPFVRGGALFMTDSLDPHSHVWINVKKVVLASASGNVTAFDDAVGVTIDLKTLRDASGNRYSFLTTVPAGTYTGITVTVDKTVTLFDQGSNVGVTRVFANNNGSTADLSLTFSSPKDLGPNTHFALDFNLSNWNDDGTTITGTPFLAEGDGSGLNDGSRHEHEDYEGSVQSLDGAAPSQTFNLVQGSHNFAVVTNAQTVIFNSDGASSPALANNERVHVRGIFDINQNAIVADSIRIQHGTGGNHDSPEAEGEVQTVDNVGFTFTMLLHEAHGFTPTDANITVATSSTTVFESGDGVSMSQADFFAALAQGVHVEAEGAFDSGSNTLTATRVRIEDGGGDGHDSQVSGPSSNANAGAGTLDVTAQSWEGMNISSGQVIHIVTNGSTEFNDGALNASQWFGGLAAGQAVEAEGSFDPGSSTLTATKLKYEH